MELFHLTANYLSLSLIRVKNSSRDLGSSLSAPSIQLVTVLLLGFCTPRITMHICLEMKLFKQLLRTHTMRNGINLLTGINITLCMKGSKIDLAAIDVTPIKKNMSERNWFKSSRGNLEIIKQRVFIRKMPQCSEWSLQIMWNWPRWKLWSVIGYFPVRVHMNSQFSVSPFVFLLLAAQHSYVPLLSLRRDSPP